MAKIKLTVGDLMAKRDKLNHAIGGMTDGREREEVMLVRDWLTDLIERIEVTF